ncbi:hypothetical protein FHS16_001305 [Paenibacillus endophyticus]|uniref:Uncharacterized protein n=1 Tax=Paenibacillus endophyticus TaxID=1294268 RepID=A0A7W5C4W6_9BACL|nr:hypothetical protein [Paenibacillus endophyticus]MBB3151262.1 hypothetical protein [Paenibacillus endophyticus]
MSVENTSAASVRTMGEQPASSLKARSQKAIAFALMLTVPLALSGCNSSSSRVCVDNDNDGYCDDDGSSRGGTYIVNGKTYKKSSSFKSSSSKGFGSSGIKSGSGG